MRSAENAFELHFPQDVVLEGLGAGVDLVDAPGHAHDRARWAFARRHVGQLEIGIHHPLRIGRDPSLLVETLNEARAEAKAQTEELEAEKAGLEHEMRRHNAQMRQLAGTIGTGAAATDRMADLLDRIRGTEARLVQVGDELTRLGRGLIDENEAARALAAFDPVWETLTLREQARMLQLLIQRVDYDGDKGTVSVTFQAAGIETLSRQYAEVNA